MKLVRFGAAGAKSPASSTGTATSAIFFGRFGLLQANLSPARAREAARPRSDIVAESARRCAPRAARRRNAQLHRHRSQLCRSRQGNEPGDPDGAHSVQQSADVDLGPLRRRDVPEEFQSHGLGVRDRLRHRRTRPLRRGQGLGEIHRRLLHLQRRVRAALSKQARRPVGERQVGRNFRPHWAHGSSRPTNSPIPTTSRCRSTSTASGSRPARPRR